MDIQTIVEHLKLSENSEWEFKSAHGGLPSSLWETYSAMANTDGGSIVLGIVEKHGKFEVQGIPDINKLQKNIWDCVQDKNCVSKNILQNDNVYTSKIDNKDILVIQVPRAERRNRPVYRGQNPLTGTFRRYHEGDYHCDDDEVRRMMSDQRTQSFDSQILEEFNENDIDSETLQQYRNRFSARNFQHQWLELNTIEFLTKLCGWGTDRQTQKQGPTVAGILMFGTEDALRDLTKNYVKYQVDYKERVSDNLSDRWYDRLTIDGSWTSNLYQFFNKVYPKLTANIKLPFAYVQKDNSLFSDPVRAGMSPVHEALQEALVNAIIHADYQGIGGITIDRFPDRFELSNPGLLLVSKEQLFRGTVSECRNPCLQLMFQMIGAGDKAGYGFDKIRRGWEEQKWRIPYVEETTKPDRFRLVLYMQSLLPDNFMAMLHKCFGDDIHFSNDEITALAIAFSEGVVSNSRIKEVSSIHPTDITKILQGLVSKGCLSMDGYGRGATYKLTPSLINSNYSENNKPSIDTNKPSLDANKLSLDANKPSLDTNDGSLDNEESALTNNLTQLTNETKVKLQEIGKEASKTSRLSAKELEKIILRLCDNQYLTTKQIADFCGRKPLAIMKRLRKMISKGEIVMAFPDRITHPHQCYMANDKK